MSRIQPSFVPCECPDFEEQTGTNYSIVTDPTGKPMGVPLHSDEHTYARGIWVFNPTSSTILYIGFRNAKDLTQCFPILPGQDKFWGVEDEMERVVAVPKRRLIPAHWFANSSVAMSPVVVVFL